MHPAVAIVGSFALGALARDLWRLAPAGGALAAVRAVGRGSIVGGLAVLVLAYGQMAWAGATIDPRRPTGRLVSTGIYRLSRNPIYLGWFLVLLGAGLENLSVGQSAMALAMAGLLHWSVVPGEERHLDARFGDAYRRYARRVRRWI